MNVNERIAALYEKDTKTAYANLLELEALSQAGDSVYPFLPEFIAMLQSDKYVIRVRGFRLLCLQARWDKDDLVGRSIGDILAVAAREEKPTALRQMLQYLKALAPYKKEQQGKIRQFAESIDLSRFKDTMMPLIEKDIHALCQTLDG